MIKYFSAARYFLIAAGILLFFAAAKAQTNSDDIMRVNEEIDRYNSDTDKVMKCTYALSVFKKEYKTNPSNPFAALYVGRAFDNVASIGGFCEIADNDFLAYSDSAIHYFHIADTLQPGIKERKYGFSVPVMIGHLFGSRCLWHLKHGDYKKARNELVRGMKEGGFSPAQIEVCRLMLDFCDSGSIFFPTGDDDTFPIMYLQMVEGYRTDVSVINASLASMKWYLELFLSKHQGGFTPVNSTLSPQELDSIEVVETMNTIPDRLYTDVDSKTRQKIHEELGIDVATRAEICFPVYQQYSDNEYYIYGVQKALASILMANKWKRRVFFGMGGLVNFLQCTHVAIREGIIADELYPITLDQAGHFKKGGRWFHEEKLKRIIFHDANMDKFSEDQPCSSGQVILYFVLAQYLAALDSGDATKKDVIEKIQRIPRICFQGSENTVFACAREMFHDGYKDEAKKECTDLLPYFEKNASGPKTSIGENEGNYIVALIISDNCGKAVDFVNSCDISQETKDATIKQIHDYYGCK